MDLSFLYNYIMPIILGICLCVGFILKYAVRTDKINNFIPLIMGCLGVFLASWLAKWSLSPDIILQGLISGLASTGCYEAFANLIKNIKLNHLDSIEDEEEYELVCQTFDEIMEEDEWNELLGEDDDDY